MRHGSFIPTVAAVLLLCSLPFFSFTSNGEDVIPVGEPLHLHIRRQPVQDMTYLFFHPPDEIYEQKSHDNMSYRKTLLSRSSGHYFEVMYFPQDPNSNFLQFEPNASIPFTYNFTILTVRPNINYILNIKIDIDYDHDGRYDKEISFDIRGEEDEKIESKTGTVPVDVSELKKFDQKEGGRIRINISRNDNIETYVTIYCGYGGHNSYLELPFSKYKYEPSADDNDGKSVWPWVLAGGCLMIIAAVAFFYFKQKQVAIKPPEPRKRKGGRRRSR